LHLSACESCRKELQVFQALHSAMSLAPVEEPSANLLAQSRIRLEAALDQLPSPNPWMRLQTSVLGLMAQLQAAPGVAAGLAVVGFLAGGMAGQVWKKQLAQPPAIVASMNAASMNRVSATRISASQASTIRASASQTGLPQAGLPQTLQVASTSAATIPQIYNVSGIVRHQDTHMVEVHYNQLVPQTIEGTMDDPAVQQLLLVATRNSIDPGVQDDSVGLLAEQCRAGHFCEGGPVRTALMVALRYDRDASVRAKALDGLEPYVAEDMHVRDAILESLMHDPSPQVRSAAIRMLQPVQADSSVRVVLQTLAAQDQSATIRNASAQALRSLPTTQ
ncbi:MAG TPA: HEAT repeat domain-containing protein, partial [Acidobacteriaceae bacterium]|nr:HEAT repeat domain-containing protein [Acidobacteriaceae bacterium]